jgi:MtrB/PioB family decaheme-associated outer membrane protein
MAGEFDEYTKPSSSVSVGVGFTGDDNRYFSQYNGLDQDRSNLLLDADVVQRDDESGTWTRWRFDTLGGDNTEFFRFDYSRQGDWGFFIEHNSIPRQYPLIYNEDVRYDVVRETTRLGISKWLSSEWRLDASYSYQNKDGDRPWGWRDASRSIVFITDPIDQVTEIFDTSLAYVGSDLQLSAGYLLSLYDNDNKVTDDGVSLPLDNEAWQTYLAGGYNFSAKTRGDFRIAYGEATTEDDLSAPTELGGISDFDGKVTTTSLKLGLAMRPIPKLGLRFNYRWEDRDDETPERQYKSGSATTENFRFQKDFEKSRFDAEANYSLAAGWRLIWGVSYEEIDRNAQPGGNFDKFEETDETTYHIKLKKRLSEKWSGSLSYSYADRDNSGLDESTSSSNGDMDPIYVAERERDKWKLTLNFTPSEQLAFQFIVQDINDDYDRSRSDAFSLGNVGVAEGYGVDSVETQIVSLDMTYQINDEWHLSAWLSKEQRDKEQYNGDINTGSYRVWAADLSHEGDGAGLSLEGQLTDTIKVGGDIHWQDDDSEQEQDILFDAFSAEDLPDIYYRQFGTRFYLDYAMNDQLSLRLDYRYQRVETDDWTWDGFTYDPGNLGVTSVTLEDDEDVHYIGLSVSYHFQ